LHAASKAANGATFAKATPNMPPEQDAKAKKAAAEAATTVATGTKPSDGTKPPMKK
jgi:hypothetical protein